MTTSKKQKVEEVRDILDRESLAQMVADNWLTWKNSRREWEAEKHEIRSYLFATDTTKTTNSQLPWANKTTIPKTTQIRDNLHANYMSNLFPRRKWLKWISQASEEEGTEEKRRAIEAYMQTKVEDSDFRNVMSELVYDYIDYGNAFAEVVFERNVREMPDGTQINGYIGPRVVRISPMDIVFDVTASRFEDAPHVVRQIKTMGQLHRDLKNMGSTPEEQEQIEEVIAYVKKTRADMASHTDAIIEEAADFHVDGFSTISDYYRSGYVEILQYDGDIFDAQTGELHEKARIIVVDRSKVVWKGESRSWLGETNRNHVGWRHRPDNLMAMGPLDNLIGMQYRIDHLENVKADVWDLIAYPPLLIKGEVEAFDWAPLERIYVDDNASVTTLAPDTRALDADQQIMRYQAQMEELAGAPKQAMGIRTPGEKTAFEVQQLENASSRIFQHKTKHFESVFVEPILNKMLEAARRNMEISELVRELDNTFGVEQFLRVAPEDITEAGKLRPIGARHFAENAQIAQGIATLYQSGVMQDPAVSAHLSGKAIARLVEEVMSLEEFDISRDNVRVSEQMESQQLASSAQTQLADEAAADEVFIQRQAPGGEGEV